MALPAFQPQYHTLGKFNPEAVKELARSIVDAQPEELKAAYDRIARLEADLNECREYLETEVDVVDGDYGQPSPNRAMQLVCMIDETLYEAEPRR